MIIVSRGEYGMEVAVCCFGDIFVSHGQQNLGLSPAVYGKWSFKIKHARLNFEQACGAFAAVSLGQNLGPRMAHITVCIYDS